MPRRAWRPAVLAGILAVGPLLAACGDERPPPRAALAGVADRTLAAGSAGFRITSVVVAGPGAEARPLTSEEGMVDFTADRSRSTSAGNGIGWVEARQLSDVSYFRVEQMPPGLAGLAAGTGGGWLKATAATRARLVGPGLEVLDQLVRPDPRTVLGMVAAVGDAAGQPRHEGDLVHHTVDVALGSVTGVPARLEGPVRQAAAALGDQPLRVEAWVDHEHRLRRLAYAVDLAGVDLPAGDTVEGELRTDVELFDFGADVTVAEPPPAQVVDLDALLGRPPG